jgi:hypothetical protein
MNLSDPGRLPTEEQLLMLRATLVPGAAGRDAAMKWLPTANIDRLGKSSRRLMPLLYDRLRMEGIDHPILRVLKGVKRHTWYNNRLLFHEAGQTIQDLRAAGIEVMLIKGAALTLAYYGDYGLRPMEDLDFMIRGDSVVAALDRMQKQGWVPECRASAEFVRKRLLNHRTALHMRNSSGRDLDLHWHLLTFCLGPDADIPFWEASREINFEGQTVRTLDPADDLLHALVHGASWDAISPIRWIPDALVIIRETPNLQWDRLVEQAGQRQLSKLVSESLRYLSTEFGSDVPQEVLARLSGIRTSLAENMEYKACIHQENLAAKVFFYLLRTRRLARGFSPWRRLRSLADALCGSGMLQNYRMIPGWICSRVWSRFSGLVLRPNEPLTRRP